MTVEQAKDTREIQLRHALPQADIEKTSISPSLSSTYMDLCHAYNQTQPPRWRRSHIERKVGRHLPRRRTNPVLVEPRGRFGPPSSRWTEHSLS